MFYFVFCIKKIFLHIKLNEEKSHFFGLEWTERKDRKTRNLEKLCMKTNLVHGALLLQFKTEVA